MIKMEGGKKTLNTQETTSLVYNRHKGLIFSQAIHLYENHQQISEFPNFISKSCKLF